jgi:hypothetical protein
MQHEPPVWKPDADGLSRYLSDAEYNDRATAANFPDVFELLKQTQAAFEKAEAAFEHDGGGTALPRLLFVRAHASYLAACRLGMSGHQSEAHAVLRAGLEDAWYGLHIAKDPAPFARAELWLRRNESEHALGACKREFTVKNVRATHEVLDPDAAADLKSLYEDFIDYGAHPNQLGVLGSVIRIAREEKTANYKAGILHMDPIPVLFTLRLCVATALGALKVVQLVYPERFALIGLDREIGRLVEQLNTVFKVYSRS